MQCQKPFRITKGLSKLEYPDGLEVPCGKCINCRIKKTQEWSIRMYHELEDHDNSIFVTLTYNDENLPENKSLKKRDLQLFFKRLRKISPNKIRYFASGEYGDPPQLLPNGTLSDGYRPHYHLIIFGLSLSQEHKQYVMDAWRLCDWNNHRIKEAFGLAEPDSIKYTAKYIQKKLSGEEGKKEYDEQGREPVFRLLSLGLGRNYCDANAEQIAQQLYVSVRGVKQSLPRYYINRLELDTQRVKDLNEQKEREIVKQLSGYDMTRNEAYKTLRNNDVEQGIKMSNKQAGLNIESKAKLKRSKL